MAFRGVHHLAVGTNDMRAQIEFFTQVLGMKLIGLFPMHGAPEGTCHSFLDAGGGCSMSFVQLNGQDIQAVRGVSHAEDAVSPVAGGAMQHLSFNVDTLEEVMNLRDRLRSHGYAALGPLDHVTSKSLYFAGPEGLLLEFATDEDCPQMAAEQWVESETAEQLGITPEELRRFISPPAFDGKGGAVPQPAPDIAVYPTPIPRPMFEAVGYLDDEALAKALQLAPEKAVAA